MPSPKERILVAAGDIFARQSISSATLDEIVASAGTTKMALYRHYEGRDDLVASWLSAVAAKSEERWRWLAETHTNDPFAQILGWTRFMATRLPSPTSRGCPFVNVAAELQASDHPAWAVIRRHRQVVLGHIERLLEDAGVADPSRMARGIMYLIDGAQGNAPGASSDVVAADLIHMVTLLIDAEAGKRS